MTDDTSPAVVWPRRNWEFWQQATDHTMLYRCPLCERPDGRMIPSVQNADGFTIEVPADGNGPSTVTWRPCGHSIIVEGRLDQPASPEVPSILYADQED